MQKLDKSSSGFLLFEVAVAVVILSIGITVVLRSFNSAIAAVKGVRDYTTAMFLLDEKMFQMETDNNLVKEGSFEDEFKKFSWKIDAVPLEKMPLDEIKASIFWGVSGLQNKLLVYTYSDSKYQKAGVSEP